MKNLPSIDKLSGILDLFLEHSNRINQFKTEKYWYPLSMATYGAEEILQALDSLCSFRTSMWEKTLEFEKRFAAYQGSNSAIMVNSGSSADLLMSYLLTNTTYSLLQPGDEILIPIVTWPTQIWSVMMAGLKVKFIDVDPATLNVDINDLENIISPRTKALFIVHLMGNPCEMNQILKLCKKYNLLLIEDCCEALGSEYDGKKVGNFGIAGSYSFFFSHHMMTMEGGMIVCNDKLYADHLKIMRAHGWIRNVDSDQYSIKDYDVDNRYAFADWGFNLRPTDVQAGFGLCQLEKLPEFNKRREEFASNFLGYIKTTKYLKFPIVDPKARPSWFALPLMVDKNAPFKRDELTSFLESKGVETRPIVAGNLARHPVAKRFPEFTVRDFPGADEIHFRGFYIGLSPLFTIQMIEKLEEVIDSFLKKFS